MVLKIKSFLEKIKELFKFVIFLHQKKNVLQGYIK